ncbi:MAG: hypothetical protein HUJ65_02145, partial [Oscillospiraceae bacterium]|nr:hypothetical protein [Oscillospiraceae bacterium]
SANVTVTTRTTGGRRPRTTYVATITAEAVGMQVTRVEYSTNGRRWTRATSYTSNSEIKALYVRLNGTEVFYFDGTETKHV